MKKKIFHDHATEDNDQEDEERTKENGDDYQYPIKGMG